MTVAIRMCAVFSLVARVKDAVDVWVHNRRGRVLEGGGQDIVHVVAVVRHDMLDDDLDRPQRHVATRHTVRGARSPLVRRYGLKEVLDGGEEFDRIELDLLEVLRDAARQLPDALENELCDTSFLRVRLGPLARERSHDLKQKSEQRPGNGR